MSDFWKKFKGVFIVEDPNQPANSQTNKTETKQAESTQQNKQNSTAQHSQPIVKIPVNADGKMNEKFLDALYKAMETVNVEGFDYFEYKQSLNNLMNMPMDEPTRYKSAFAMAQTMGATPQKLIHTAQGYVEALRQEDTKFQQAANNQIQSQIGNKQAQIENFEAVINQKNEQIKKLVQEIDQHKKEMEQLKLDITQSSSKVAQTKADFEATYQALVTQIQTDITNMKNYLT